MAASIKAAYCFLDSFETGDTISIDTTDASMVVAATGSGTMLTATLDGRSADVFNYVVGGSWGRMSVFASPTIGTSVDFTWTQSSGDIYLWLIVLSGTVNSGSTIDDFFRDTYELQGAATTWSYDRTTTTREELIVSCFAQQSQTFDSITDGTDAGASYPTASGNDATTDTMLVGYRAGIESSYAYSVEVTATAYTNAFAIGFVPRNASIPKADFGPLKFSRPWTKQPPAGTGIDWGNPLSRHLLAAYVLSPDFRCGAKYINLANPGKFDADISGTHSYTAAMGGVNFNNDGSANTTTVSGGLFDGVSNFSVACGAQQLSTGTDDVNVSIYGQAGGGTDFQIGNLTGSCYCRAYVNTGLAANVEFYAAHQTQAMRYIASQDTDNTTIYGYSRRADGDVQSGSQFDADIRAPDTGRKLLIGWDADSLGTDGDGDPGNYIDGNLQYVFVFDIALSAAQAHGLNANPWQIFKPRTILAGKAPERKVVVF
jgi:hypothetical protein